MPQTSEKNYSAIPDAISHQAAEWIVRLSVDDPAQREHARAGFEAWKHESPLHAQAAAGMQKVIGRIESVRAAAGGRSEPGRAALNATLNGSRAGRTTKIIASLVIACVIGWPAWRLLQDYPLAYLTADIRTGTGRWETRMLSDGSRITLASNSAVDLHFDPRRRALSLVKGEILVEVAHDATRPFLVETAEGTIRALGTRFVVERDGDVTVLSMLQSRVVVQTAAQLRMATHDSAIVNGGQRVRITAEGLGPIEDIDARSISDAWKYHQLVVRNQPLPEVLDQLGRYRTGRIFYDRVQIANINVAAVLPLDDTDRALQLLADSLPAIRIRRMTPWVVVVDAPKVP